jgi:hypothetical protein
MAATMPSAIVCAQEANPNPGEVVALEQIPAKLAAFEAELQKKGDAARKMVDGELVAKHISEPLALSLRSSLRTIAAGSPNADVRSLIPTSRVPPDNVPLVKAFGELEETALVVQNQRTALARSSLGEVKRRVAQMLRSEPDQAAIDRLISTIEQLNDMTVARFTSSSNYEAANVIPSALRMLRALKGLIEAEGSGSVDVISRALSQLRVGRQSDPGGAFDLDAQARIQRSIRPFAAEVEQAQKVLDAAINEAKLGAEIGAALARLAEATERLATLPPINESGQQRDIRAPLTTYRIIADAARAAEAGDIQGARKQLRDATNSLTPLGPSGAAIAARLSAWDRSLNESAAKSETKEMEELSARLSAVKEPAELATFSSELLKRENERREENPIIPRGFASQLALLATAWTIGDVHLLSRSVETAGLNVGLTNAFIRLRQRIERNALSRTAKAPELEQAPLAEQPLEAAVEKLVDDLARRGEWRRVYQLLQARFGAASRTNGAARTDDTIEALRAYFSGQNLELADQWAEAAQAYKSVLRSVSDRAPIQEAAQRLKVLTREHPEAFGPRGQCEPIAISPDP